MNHLYVGFGVTMITLFVLLVAFVTLALAWWLAQSAPVLFIPIGIAVGVGIAAGLFDWYSERNEHGED